MSSKGVKFGKAYQGAHILYMKVSGNLGVPVFLPSAFLYSCAFPNRQQMFLTRQARSELARAPRQLFSLVGWVCAAVRTGSEAAAAAVSSFMPRPLSKELYAREMNTPLVWTPPPPPPPPLDNELSALSASC